MNHIRPAKKGGDSSDEDVKVCRTATDVQRYKLEKLLKNIHKPAPIPQPKKERAPQQPVQFVRNVVGSSAGAGSGEYHIYRNLRKREMARLDFIEKQAKKDELNQEFADKVESKKAALEAKAAKRRAKRLRIKARRQQRQNNRAKQESSSSESDESDEHVETVAATAEPVQDQDQSNDHADAHPVDLTSGKGGTETVRPGDQIVGTEWLTAVAVSQSAAEEVTEAVETEEAAPSLGEDGNLKLTTSANELNETGGEVKDNAEQIGENKTEEIKEDQKEASGE